MIKHYSSNTYVIYRQNKLKKNEKPSTRKEFTTQLADKLMLPRLQQQL